MRGGETNARARDAFSLEEAAAGPSPDGAREQGLRTRDVLLATHITHQILYRYITLGLIEEATTTSTGQRLFDSRTVPAIRIIQRLNQSGYTLRDIKDIFFKEGRLRNARRARLPAR